uniref:Tetratricopeptide repeat protein 7A n=1 Tax=Anthurium amnicola TaxID=1678845 RepID=A0A1D1Z2H3_9ARAE
MLCACSGEQFRLDDVPRSPESLATRDFSVGGLSGQTGEWDPRCDDSQVDDVESTLKETLSLNYEEARALLGRLEYQRGNLDAAFQVFQGINVCSLKPRMTRAIVERSHLRKNRSKGGIMQVNVMSMHSVSLLLEAILLKSKSLEGLGQVKEAAMECKIILDIVEAACPNGMPDSIGDDCRLQEMFHQALMLLPSLWKKAGFLDEAIYAYRRALTKPWNLPSQKLAIIQKDLVALLLYSGVDANSPHQLQHVSSSDPPMNNVEEAVLLLFILTRKLAFQEIDWDPEIIDHLSFALSICGQFELLANHVEQLFPGIYNRRERWFLLALCYSSAGQDDVALNLLRKVLGYSERKHKPHLPSLLLGAKLCSQNRKHACDGIGFAERAIKHPDCQGEHFAGRANQLLGTCYGLHARSCVSDSERHSLHKQSLHTLQHAVMVQKDDADLILSLGLETAMQGNLSAALVNGTKCLEMTAGSSVRAWELLALAVSAEQNFRDAEAIINLALDETGARDHLRLLRLKGILQNLQEQPIHAIETYRILLTMVQAQSEQLAGYSGPKEALVNSIEMDAWLDLASIYGKLGSWDDSEICLDKAKTNAYFSPKFWHAKGQLLEAQGLHDKALLAFTVSLSIEPDYAPSMVSSASVLSKLGRKALPIARSFTMNALQLEPMNHKAWLNLGHISKMEGFLMQAADCFQAAYELNQSSLVTDPI